MFPTQPPNPQKSETTEAARNLSKLNKSPSRNPPAHIYTLISPFLANPKFPNNARENKKLKS